MQKTSPQHDWHVLTLATQQLEREELSHLLAELETAGILEEEKNGQLFFQAYFHAHQPLQEVRSNVQQALSTHQLKHSTLTDAITCTLNPNEQGWKQYFQPFTIAKNIVIAPSWEEYHKKPDELVLTLNPGLAFGTGLHETTKLCAEAIAELIPVQRPGRFLDLGCGSGILALMAKKLGAHEVWGVDTDPVAIEVAQENTELNNEENLHWSIDLQDAKNSFDFIVANILLLPLLELKKTIISKLNPGAYLVLSGITVDQQTELLEAYTASGMRLVSEHSKGEWAALVLQKPL